MEVHRILGFGFLESVYHEALILEFKTRDIPFDSEKELTINYKGTVLNKTFKCDFICFDNIIVELKALDKITNEHYAQVLNYLKATGFKIGLIINFGSPSLDFKRIINNFL